MTCEQFANTTVCSPAGSADERPSYKSLVGATGSASSEGQLISEALRERGEDGIVRSEAAEEGEEGGPGFLASPIRPAGHLARHQRGTCCGGRQRPTREPRTGRGWRRRPCRLSLRCLRFLRGRRCQRGPCLYREGMGPGGCSVRGTREQSIRRGPNGYGEVSILG